MFATAPLFGRFDSTLGPSAATLRSQPIHHLAGVCRERINPRFLEPNPICQRKRRTALYSQMLAAIALDELPLRPDRREPRCRKRRPKAYPLMTKPRSQMQDRPKGGYRARK